ncbi:hypothetical protein [Serratia symbiotica]|uniref:hypothetical protein n=1 Tax=Serratia symbiotica TaxID=138074 RepID=UPI0030D052C9
MIDNGRTGFSQEISENVATSTADRVNPVPDLHQDGSCRQRGYRHHKHAPYLISTNKECSLFYPTLFTDEHYFYRLLEILTLLAK